MKLNPNQNYTGFCNSAQEKQAVRDFCAANGYRELREWGDWFYLYPSTKEFQFLNNNNGCYPVISVADLQPSFATKSITPDIAKGIQQTLLNRGYIWIDGTNELSEEHYNSTYYYRRL